MSYDYDARSRLTTIDSKNVGGVSSPRNGQPLATYAYDAQGRIDKLTRGNNVVSTYSYDMAGQLSDITHAAGGTVLARSAYTLDPLGNRTSTYVVGGVPSPRVSSYTANALNQYTQVSAA